MDLHELGLAAAEVASIEAALGDARRALGDAEAERARLAAEGPAAHRKKDLLDKARGWLPGCRGAGGCRGQSAGGKQP